MLLGMWHSIPSTWLGNVNSLTFDSGLSIASTSTEEGPMPKNKLAELLQITFPFVASGILVRTVYCCVADINMLNALMDMLQVINKGKDTKHHIWKPIGFFNGSSENENVQVTTAPTTPQKR